MNGVTVNEFPWQAFFRGGYKNYELKGYPYGNKSIDSLSPKKLDALVAAWKDGTFSIAKKTEVEEEVAQN